MKRLSLFIALGACLVPHVLAADMAVATRTLRAQMVVGPQDFVMAEGHQAGIAATPDQVIGLETRVAIYAGRPIRLADLGPPAIIDRNQPVTLVFQQGALQIRTEGRALGRAAHGETVRVMNLASRNTVLGRVGPDGHVFVSR